MSFNSGAPRCTTQPWKHHVGTFTCRDLVVVQSLVMNHSFSQWLKVRLFQDDPVSALELSHIFYIHTRDTLKKKKTKLKGKQVHLWKQVWENVQLRDISLQPTSMLASKSHIPNKRQKESILFCEFFFKEKWTTAPEWIIKSTKVRLTDCRKTPLKMKQPNCFIRSIYFPLEVGRWDLD